ncbi:MAG: SdrD B-like domain-containing protein [Gaiellales bacterium]
MCMVLMAFGLVLGVPSIASAGTITGTAYLDYNSNGAKDVGAFVSGTTVKATDTAAAGVVVTAYDAAGTVVGTATTQADGAYVLTTSTAGLVRLQFATPMGYQPSFMGAENGTSVRFVAVGSTGVDFGIVDIGQYCQNNPMMFTFMQQATDEMTTFPNSKGIVKLPAVFSHAQTFSDAGVTMTSDTTPLASDVTTVAKMNTIGSTFGVGVDRTGNAYFGTYVKRHSPYGPAGAKNAIYRVNIAAGTSSTFVDLGGTLPAHSDVVPANTSYPPFAQDGRREITVGQSGYSRVYFDVGRAGLGDVDVTPDGSAILAVEMTQAAPKLWRIPIDGSGDAVTAGTAEDTVIPVPSNVGVVSCIGPWHPTGIATRGDRVLVGGVCGGDESRFVNSVTGRTDAAAFVLEATRQMPGGTYAFTTIAGIALGYVKGASAGGANFSPATAGATGLWNNWYDGAPNTTYPSVGRPKPMLANVEIMDNGDLTLAFRDRFYDQVKPCGTVWFEWNSVANPTPTQQDCNVAAAAEMLRLCKTATGYEREQAGTCAGVTGGTVPQILLNATSSERADSPLYFGIPYGIGDTYVTHPYTGQGGAATMPGSPVVWSTTYDITSIYQQGIRAVGPCPARTGNGQCGPAGRDDGAMTGGAILRLSPGTTGLPGSAYSFYKGNGLGDLELICDAAPVQIGNRVWLDSDKDGVQDPDEPAVPGVTVHLYDSGSTLVGTAITGADGTYYFASLGGDGASVGGGLKPGEAFTVKFDKAEDYAAGGPLYGYTLTTANATSPDTAANSKATLVGGNPTISIPARTAGQNNHTFDVGFVTNAVVGMGDYTWIDTNKDGLQDADEPPLEGVEVQLLNTDGTIAKDADGNAVAPVTTDVHGYYFVGNLLPYTYTARFTLPSGYAFTTPTVGPSERESKPVPTDNPLIGVTGPFQILASSSGDTTAVTKPNASFANLTIDAGVIKAVDAGAASASATTREANALVAVGDYTWVDVNRDGVQGEQALPGVTVTLLTTTGKRARDADGKTVATKTTNARGYYVFDALEPGKYKVQFQIPAGMTFTKTSKQKDARDSNPIPTKANPQIGITPVFEVYAEVKGNTVKNTNAKLRASYIDPTIDAGVVFCAHTELSPTTVQVGRSNRVIATVTLAGKPFAKRKVILSGNGVRMTATTNAKGVAVFTLSPDAAGSYTVRVVGEAHGCQPQLLGAANGQSLTG